MTIQQSCNFYPDPLNNIPSNWALIPCNSENKAPFLSGWQMGKAMPSEDIVRWVRDKDCETVGVRTGEVSGGLLAVDFDGGTALSKYRELSGGHDPLSSVMITSHTPGHAQIMYVVDPKYWSYMTKQRRSFTTNKNPLEHLEFRWNNHQSIVWGKHPSGRDYSWVYSPKDFIIAPCPLFIIELFYE